MTDSRRRALLAAALACCGGVDARAQAATTPRQAPEIALLASDGMPALGAQPAARATWVDFWASWCTPCLLSFPWLNDMHDRYAARGLRIVAINLDRRDADAQRFLQQRPARFALAFDPAGESARALAVQAMPSAYLVAPDRRIVLAHRGFRLDDRAALEAELQRALANA